MPLRGPALSPRREPHHLALGIERIGLVSLRFPWIVALVLAGLCIAAAFGIGRIRIGVPGLVEHEIDFSKAEPGQLDIELKVDEPLQLDRQNLPVPAGVERQLVVSDDVSAPLSVREMRQFDCRHGLPAQRAGGLHPAMAGNDLAVLGDQHRVGESKPADRRRYLLELLLRMGPRIAR